MPDPAIQRGVRTVVVLSPEEGKLLDKPLRLTIRQCDEDQRFAENGHAPCQEVGEGGRLHAAKGNGTPVIPEEREDLFRIALQGAFREISPVVPGLLAAVYLFHHRSDRASPSAKMISPVPKNAI